MTKKETKSKISESEEIREDQETGNFLMNSSSGKSQIQETTIDKQK